MKRIAIAICFVLIVVGCATVPVEETTVYDENGKVVRVEKKPVADPNYAARMDAIRTIHGGPPRPYAIIEHSGGGKTTIYAPGDGRVVTVPEHRNPNDGVARAAFGVLGGAIQAAAVVFGIHEIAAAFEGIAEAGYGDSYSWGDGSGNHGAGDITVGGAVDKSISVDRSVHDSLNRQDNSTSGSHNTTTTTDDDIVESYDTETTDAYKDQSVSDSHNDNSRVTRP